MISKILDRSLTPGELAELSGMLTWREATEALGGRFRTVEDLAEYLVGPTDHLAGVGTFADGNYEFDKNGGWRRWYGVIQEGQCIVSFVQHRLGNSTQDAIGWIRRLHAERRQVDSCNVVNLADLAANLPPAKAPLVDGLLHRAGTMLVASSSKASKTWFMMQGAIAIANGRKWMGKWNCEQGRVLYVDMELRPEGFVERMGLIHDALGLPQDYASIDYMAGAKGAQAMHAILDEVKGKDYAAVLIDPVYRLLDGQENDPVVLTEFAWRVEDICSEGPAVILCHHASTKAGSQGRKAVADRSSGHGILGRFVDAVVDIDAGARPPANDRETLAIFEAAELRKSPDATAEDVAIRAREQAAKASCLSFEFALRDFEAPARFNAVFAGYLHHELPPCAAAPRRKTKKKMSPAERKAAKADAFHSAFQKLAKDGVPQVADLAQSLDLTDKTIRNHAKSFGYEIENGQVSKKPN